ncbi:DUF368 domain-containing protein [Brachybacterium squillarum]|uniref:DUF368 domain-containing protein n=1 Tax=Brachybacterium squillarum TaxID=661979 RepID=UPI000262994B|nr:DUF368 domain-containing protein [Brachybacterium squillarum]
MDWVKNFLRGGAIGTSEALPGISGGTVALIVGLYADLIGGAGHVLGAVRHLVTDVPRGRGTAAARARLAEANWRVLIPALLGMPVCLIATVLVVEPLIHSHTQLVYALFFGLVLGSLPIPYRSSGSPWRPVHYLLGLAVAAIAFVVVGLPQVQLTPYPWVIFLGAAVAVCALVLPGLSGSFILLTLGLYEPVLSAVRNVELGYIALFALGAVVGLGTFVQVLQYLLSHHQHLTLVVLTGLMAGSLRALWPWGATATENGDGTAIWALLLAMVVGFGIVSAIIWRGEHTDVHATR